MWVVWKESSVLRCHSNLTASKITFSFYYEHFAAIYSSSELMLWPNLFCSFQNKCCKKHELTNLKLKLGGFSRNVCIIKWHTTLLHHKALDREWYVHTTRTPLEGTVQTFISSLGNDYGISVAQCYITKKDTTVSLFSSHVVFVIRLTHQIYKNIRHVTPVYLAQTCAREPLNYTQGAHPKYIVISIYQHNAVKWP